MTKQRIALMGAGLIGRENVPISVEVPNDKRASAIGATEWAKQALAAATSALAAARSDSPVVPCAAAARTADTE